VVSGYFDPMVAGCAEELAKLKKEGKPLLVLIADPPEPILPALARAQLVAGLAVVDYVCDTPGEFAPDVTPAVTLEARHAEGLQNLIRHVHSRQRAAS
jgi:hypothetical protein